MTKYYHFTATSNLYSIMKNGLIPQKGYRTASILDNTKAVFLSYGIDKSIKMYAQMRGYYNKVKGEGGDNALQSCYRDINFFNNLPGDHENDIRECYADINRINSMRSFNSFNEYLGGSCRLLSVTGVNVKNVNVPEDCHCEDLIPPSQIKLLYLVDKNTGYCIYELEPILAYCMHSFKVNYFIGDTNEDIKNLYNYMMNSYLWGYDSNNYQLFELPIICFDQDYQNVNMMRY